MLSENGEREKQEEEAKDLFRVSIVFGLRLGDWNV